MLEGPLLSDRAERVGAEVMTLGTTAYALLRVLCRNTQCLSFFCCELLVRLFIILIVLGGGNTAYPIHLRCKYSLSTGVFRMLV